MEKSDIEIQVRTISGESTILWVSPKNSIEDLKLLLKQTFPPAHRFPNFHLFFKGVKLKSQSRIGTLEIGKGEFLVLVPFTKKDTSQTTRTQNSNHSKTSMQVPNQPSISKFADSAWSEMVQDLSYLGDTSVSKAPELKIGSFNLRDRRDALAGTASSCSSENAKGAESIQASLAGKNFVVATMTSSGKSLCYNLPVLEVLSQNMLACALYLFPTKALAQDQLRALSVLTKELNGSLNIGVYDSDTPKEDRKWLRDIARLQNNNLIITYDFFSLIPPTELMLEYVVCFHAVDHKSRHVTYINITTP